MPNVNARLFKDYNIWKFLRLRMFSRAKNTLLIICGTYFEFIDFQLPVIQCLLTYVCLPFCFSLRIYPIGALKDAMNAMFLLSSYVVTDYALSRLFYLFQNYTCVF